MSDQPKLGGCTIFIQENGKEDTIWKYFYNIWMISAVSTLLYITQHELSRGLFVVQVLREREHLKGI